MLGLLDGPLARLGPQQRKWVLDATAVAAYHAEVGFAVVKLLVCDPPEADPAVHLADGGPRALLGP